MTSQTIVYADCRKYTYPDGFVCITDPPWTAKSAPVEGCERAAELWAEVIKAMGQRCKRLVVHLSCDTDPRPFLGPIGLPFVRYFHLRYDVPRYRGRILNGSDIAYMFGDLPQSRLGLRVLPGETRAVSNPYVYHPNHPCPRSIAHVQWLVDKCTDPNDIVIDPFAGSGTTIVACKNLNRSAIGIEINPDYCREAELRLQQDVI